IENAQRTGRPADLWQRAAGKGEDTARAVAGSRNPRTHAGGNRHARVLVIPRTSGCRLHQVHGESRGQPGRYYSLEGAGPEVALPPQRLSAGQASVMECRVARRAVRNAPRNRARGPVLVEQPAGRSFHGAASARTVGDDPDEKAAGPAAALDRPQGAVWSGP